MGFGRYSTEQPAATLDKIPLTNIAFIDGIAVPKNAMHPGYIITSTGVEIGLNLSNTFGFRKTKLDPVNDCTKLIDWKAPNVSLAVDKSHWNNGTALFDTGIHQSYIRLDPETTAHLHRTAIIENNKKYIVLADDSTVYVQIGNPPDYIAQYNVTVSDTQNPVRPYCGEFRTERPSPPPPFINTGRYFYREYEAMLDAECGWFGLRRRVEPIKGRCEQCFPALSVQDPRTVWRR